MSTVNTMHEEIYHIPNFDIAKSDSVGVWINQNLPSATTKYSVCVIFGDEN